MQTYNYTPEAPDRGIYITFEPRLYNIWTALLKNLNRAYKKFEPSLYNIWTELI